MLEPELPGPEGPHPEEYHSEDAYGVMHNLVEKVEREIGDMKEDEVPIIDIEMAVTRKYPEVSDQIEADKEKHAQFTVPDLRKTQSQMRILGGGFDPSTGRSQTVIEWLGHRFVYVHDWGNANNEPMIMVDGQPMSWAQVDDLVGDTYPHGTYTLFTDLVMNWADKAIPEAVQYMDHVNDIQLDRSTAWSSGTKLQAKKH